MASDYSTNYGFELIETGAQAGEWGESTNENLRRIDAAIGRSVEIDIDNPPTGSSYDAGTKTLTWVSSDTADTGIGGDEYRASLMAFTNSGATDIGADLTVKVRGATISAGTERVFIVRNNLSHNRDLILNQDPAVGAVDYTVRSGNSVLAFTTPAAVGDTAAHSVATALGMTQLEGVDLRDTTAAEIIVQDTQVAALSVTDGTDSHLVVDTSGNRLVVGTGSADGKVVSSGSAKLVLGTSAGNADIEVTPHGSGGTVVTTGDVTITSGDLGVTAGTITGQTIDASSGLLWLAPDQVKAGAIDKKANSGIEQSGNELTLNLSATGISGVLKASSGGTGNSTNTANSVVVTGTTSSSSLESEHLGSGKILIGQSAGPPLAKAPYGDVTMSAAGEFTVAGSTSSGGALSGTTLTLTHAQPEIGFSPASVPKARIFWPPGLSDRLYLESGDNFAVTGGIRVILDAGDRKLWVERRDSGSVSRADEVALGGTLTKTYTFTHGTQSATTATLDGTRKYGSGSNNWYVGNYNIGSWAHGVTDHAGVAISPKTVTRTLRCTTNYPTSSPQYLAGASIEYPDPVMADPEGRMFEGYEIGGVGWTGGSGAPQPQWGRWRVGSYLMWDNYTIYYKNMDYGPFILWKQPQWSQSNFAVGVYVKSGEMLQDPQATVGLATNYAHDHVTGDDGPSAEGMIRVGAASYFETDIVATWTQ